MEKIESIPINIWDDYYDDGYVPEGEKQETYLYVEDTDLSLEFRKNCLDNLIQFIKINVSSEVKVFEYFYDSKIKYPNLNAPEYEKMHFSRPEIRFENLTHKERYSLLKKLEDSNLKYKGISYRFYSES